MDGQHVSTKELQRQSPRSLHSQKGHGRKKTSVRMIMDAAPIKTKRADDHGRGADDPIADEPIADEDEAPPRWPTS